MCNCLFATIAFYTFSSYLCSTIVQDGNREASTIDLPIPQSRAHEYDSVTATQQSASGASAKSVLGAHHFVSLYFALCTKV